MKILLAIAGIVLAVGAGTFLFNGSPDYFNEDGNYYNVGTDGIAVGGYDLIEYHQNNVAVVGDAQYASEHDGVTYHFQNSSNLEKFNTSPDQYLPAYGGYCAFGLGMDVGDGLGNHKPGKYPVNPEAFKLIDGKLHVFYRGPQINALELWNNMDERNLMSKADERWRLIGRP